MILLIDNYDSFSYNLYQFVGTINQDIKVVRNDAVTIAEITQMNPSHIILSPGPGYPKDAGICIEVVRKLGASIPILGVCLGHQAICEAFGATVTYAKILMHGKASQTRLHSNCPIFHSMPEEIKAARYHSLAALRETLPECLRATAETEDGEIMGVMHSEFPVYGVQFHPESILTPNGLAIIENFLNCKGRETHD